MTTINLTDMQRAVLLAFPGGASSEGDNGSSWTDVADLAKETGLSKKQVQGVLSGLSTKGLIYADEDAANGAPGKLQCLTDEGARAVGALSDTAAAVIAEVEADAAKAETIKALAEEVVEKATKTGKADLSAQVAILDKAFADAAAIREKDGMCAMIRAVAKANPTLPLAAFVAAGTKIGHHKATISIQRNKALRG